MINIPETYEVEVPDDEGDDGDAEDEDGESDSSVPKLELVPGQSSIEKDLSGKSFYIIIVAMPSREVVTIHSSGIIYLCEAF